jgi:hypothetical protein
LKTERRVGPKAETGHPVRSCSETAPDEAVSGKERGVVAMYSHLSQLPIAGDIPMKETQATVDDLSNLVMPVINHPEIKEIGFSVTRLPMDSDPELYEVRRIWVRTTFDESRSPSELGLFASDHPTLGSVLFGAATTALGHSVDALWNALRDSRYRDAVLSSFGHEDVVVSRNGITVVVDTFDDFDDDWR